MLRSFSLFLLLAAGAHRRALCDLIFSARYVFTMGRPQCVIEENGAVAARGERIVAAGTRAEIDRNCRSLKPPAHPSRKRQCLHQLS